MRVVLLFLATMLACAMTPAAFAQEKTFSRTTVDGVYTAAQAERGKEAYTTNCSSCHAKDLAGQAGPPLKGELFMDNWREDRVKPLFTYMRTRMPQRAAGSLSEQTYLDILSFILSENMLPAGSKELVADAVGDIQLVGPEGPGAMPKFALVSVVGCLMKGEVEWRLEKVSSPIREHDEKPTARELEISETTPLGTGSLRLVYIEDLRPGFIAERNAGKKLHAQGYLLNNDKGEGLSVSSLLAVGTCTDN
jgi:mono/diheme cytochrome c family protein